MVKSYKGNKNPKVYPSEGRCIYCGKGGDAHLLTREHVIPKGLGGGSLFLRASCKSCEIVTGRFEEECLRDNFSIYRAIAKFPSTRSPIKGPRILCLPSLPRPGILVGRPLTDELICGNMHIWSGFDPSDGPFRGVQINFNISAFIRMLEKIAHGHAVGELGIDGFSHLLPPVILGEFSKISQHLVGVSDNEFFVPNDDVDPINPSYTAHEIYLKLLRRESDILAIVGVRLFAAHGAPFYECVAGPLTSEGHTRLGLHLSNQGADIDKVTWIR